MYDVGILIFFECVEVYGENLYFIVEEVEEIEVWNVVFVVSCSEVSDLLCDVFEVGGCIGGYNMFWIDCGEMVMSVDGCFCILILSKFVNGCCLLMMVDGVVWF